MRDTTISALTRVFRTFLRYVPIRHGKQTVLNRIVDPYLSWRDHSAIAKTTFGAKFNLRLPDFIQARIYYFGRWEPNLTNFISSRLKLGDVFVDVGANIGYFSLMASKLVGPSGRVFAVEASPRIFKLLQENIKLNGSGNIVAINVAASDTAGTLPIYIGNETNLGRTSTVKSYALQQDQKLETQIEAKPLPDIVDIDDLLRARIIKIDVEGAEASVIKGIKPLLGKFCDETEWVVEISPARNEESRKEIADILNSFRGAGYDLYQLENDYSDTKYINPDLGVIIHPLSEITRQIDLLATKQTFPPT